VVQSGSRSIMSDRSLASAAPLPVMALHSRSNAVLASSIIAVSTLWFLAYAWAAYASLDLSLASAAGGGFVGAIAALAIVAVRWPFALTLTLLAILPFFGNHPGGRFMEIVNLPLAASAAGLAWRAWKDDRPRPTGLIWGAALAYALCAIVAIVPVIPGMLVRAAEINDWRLTLAEALTAAESNPLYSIASLAMAMLTVMWAAALAWTAPGLRFARHAFRVITIALFLVVAAGVLDYHGFISLERSYMLRIDPRSPETAGLQSIFWNPGWFAWYFVVAFGFALGLLWLEGARARIALGGLLAACYGYSFANPQRGGLLAIHAMLAVAAFVALRRLPSTQRALIKVAGLVAVAALLVGGVLYVSNTRTQFAAIDRVITTMRRVIQSPNDIMQRTAVRPKLWGASVVMWRSAPVFGIGEGAFAWRFREFVPYGSEFDSHVYGDAHSTWLQILATRGLAGLVAYVFLLVGIVQVIRRKWSAPTRYPESVGLGLALTGFVVYSFVQAMFYLQLTQVLFWLIVALAAREVPGRTPRTASTRTIGIVAAAVIGALIVQGVLTRPLFARATTITAQLPRGFYPIEPGGPQRALMRWSSREGVLCLQPTTPRVRLRFALPDPLIAQRPRTITLSIDGRDIDRFVIADDDVHTRVVEVPFDPAATPRAALFGECGNGDVRLTVTASDTWTPISRGLGTDKRRLGVAVFAPTYVDASEPLTPPVR
jgi:O-antigen ligase